ncbi:cytochrome P450 [Novosphingobium sp. ERN07]|uniref:cytochrome P450 n=1 Tax=Novosphingobium sp. ERN07 TaxID=2726187 RepID=UPI00145633AF|nr:cytochrome P450 [Novosphingobium sp. ERN07]NLR73408.1 cytochrome P450 [Novosphingobium sp. ERN07]
MGLKVDSIPGNVPEHLIVDFDFFDLAGKADDIQTAWSTLHQGPDIVWTPHNGGHWIATRAEDFDVIQVDHEHFSHQNFNLPRNTVDATALPLGLDPPRHTPYRKLLMPTFMPKALKVLEDIARDTARKLVEDIAPRRKCEFIEDFAKVLPINVFLGMVDLPVEDRSFLLPWAEVAVRSSDIEERMATHMKMHQYLAPYIDERMARPGHDIISVIAQGEIDGRPITREEVFGMSVLLLFGGLDTVASQLGFIAHFLATRPEHLAQLAANPKLNQVACEELIRRFGLPNTARVLTMDYEYKGIEFRKGDMIQLPKCLYGLDDRINDRPFDVDFSRKPSTIRHSAFGSGPHTCPGAVLARREIMVSFDEWLSRIPHFKLQADKPVVMASGPVNGVLELHLEWDA